MGKQQTPEDAAPGRVGRARDGTGLTRLVRLETLQSMQDRFARLGQFSVCICDAKGHPLTRPTWGSPYSELIGTSPHGAEEWHDALRLIARHASPQRRATSRIKAPPVDRPEKRTARRSPIGRASPSLVILEGMTLYAAPVRHRRRKLAVIVVGTRALRGPTAGVLAAIAARYEVSTARLKKSLKPEYAWTGGTPESIHRFADLLSETLSTLYAQAERIDRQLADLRIVHGLAKLLAGSQGLQQILDATVARVADVMAAKASAIRLLDERTGELVIKARYNLSEDYLRKGPVTLDANAIDAAAFHGETVYIQDAPTDPRIRYPENARREGIVSGLCVPMTFRAQTIGVLRVYSGVRRRFLESDRQLLRSIAAQAAAAVINSRLHESHARDERDRRQIKAAGQIQRRMLPSRAPSHAALEFGCVYEPSLQLSGDFFDFVGCRDGALGVCIADVMGKGLPAALLMASVRSSLRAHAAPARTVADLVTRANRDMCRDTMISEFATLFFGLFSRDGRRLTYCSAGHVPTLLVRGRTVKNLEVGGGVIGVNPDETFEQDTLALQPDDLVVMMTDGVTEAFDFHDRAYGSVRAIRSVLRHRALPAQPLARQLLWDVRRFVGLADQSDDITIVAAKVRNG